MDLRRPDLPLPRPVPAELDLAELTPATMPLLQAAMVAEADLVELRLARGCRAFIGSVHGAVVAYGWLSKGVEWIGEVGLEIRPLDGDAYIWNCVTSGEHRYRGYFRALLEYIMDVARAEGLRRLWIGAADGGAESAVTGAGFVPALDLQTFTVAGIRRVAVRYPAGVDAALLSAAVSLRRNGGGHPISNFQRVQLRRH